MAKDGIEAGRGALEEIKEGTGMEAWLLEVEIQFHALGLGIRQVLGQDFSLEASHDFVVKLELGVEGVGGVPSLGQGEA